MSNAHMCSGFVRLRARPLADRCHNQRSPARRRQSARAGRVCASAAEPGRESGTIAREVLLPAERSKLDAADDRRWYSQPRLVHHVDQGFRSQLTQLYRECIPEGASVLDLCSSWISHLPPDKKYASVTGHGLNAEELARNAALDSFFVRDLNTDPDGWAAKEGAYDAVVCCCSAQYLQQPERVFAEIYRVLKPGGVVIISFSNRLFYEKAVAAWRDASGYARLQLVKQYIMAVRGFTEPEAVTKVGAALPANPFEAAVRAARTLFQHGSGDPFYAVVAYRDRKRVER